MLGLVLRSLDLVCTGSRRLSELTVNENMTLVFLGGTEKAQFSDETGFSRLY